MYGINHRIGCLCVVVSMMAACGDGNVDVALGTGLTQNLSATDRNKDSSTSHAPVAPPTSPPVEIPPVSASNNARVPMQPFLLKAPPGIPQNMLPNPFDPNEPMIGDAADIIDPPKEWECNSAGERIG